MCKLKEFWKNIKQQILIKYNRRVEIDEKVVFFGASKTEIEDAEIRKNVNHTILIAKLAISKYKYGKYKNLEMIFETELEMRCKEHK